MSAAFSPPVRAPRTPACRLATSRADLDRHFGVRRAVFVVEQGLFPGDDRDAWDEHPETLHAVGSIGGGVAGAVRLYPFGDGRWKGDRLAVLPAARHGLLGAELVRFAVATAGARGGRLMVAMIQVPNVHFFEGLGWRRAGEAGPYHGAPHQPMDIVLTSRAP